jgi:microcystin-dependent protein
MLMSEPYIGEIRMVGFNFAPQGWAVCDGSSRPIAEYEALFNLIGTTYGGDGQATFNLPDLRGRLPVHPAAAQVIGQSGGQEAVAVSTNDVPAHTHPAAAVTAAGNQSSPVGNVWAATTGGTNLYSSSVGTATLNPGAVSQAGGNQPHDNLSPYVVLNFIISLFGVFPSQA